MSVIFPPNNPIDVEEFYFGRNVNIGETLKTFLLSFTAVEKMMQNQSVILPVKSAMTINN
jgi:hypothetical protein